MKTILIPTDYHPTSLDYIQGLTTHLKGEEMNLIFVHMFKLSDSVTDLMMLGRRSREYEKVTDKFYQCCNQAIAQYPQIKNIRIEFLYGSTLSMFKDFLEHNEVDAVLEPQNYLFCQIHKSSIDTSVLIQKCGLPVINVNKTYERVKQPEINLPVYQDELATEV